LTSRLNFDRKILAALVTAWVIVVTFFAITWRLLIGVDSSTLSASYLAIIVSSLFILTFTAVLLGSYFWVRQTWRLMREQNEVLKQQLNERLSLVEMERSQPALLANMSHELRSPLNVIIGFSDMLKDGMLGELDPKQQDAVSDILGAGTQLLALINDVLNLSKTQTGTLDIQTTVIDLTKLFKGSMQLVKQQAINARVGLSIELDPSLGTLVGDERQIKQITYELLSNAITLTPKGGNVSLRANRCPMAQPCRALPTGASDERIEISVANGGDSSRQGQGSHFCVWLPVQVAPIKVEKSTGCYAPLPTDVRGVS
jgi:signal transduction histidine kinase